MDFGSCLQVGFFNVCHGEDYLQTDHDLSHDTNMKARGDKGKIFSITSKDLCTFTAHFRISTVLNKQRNMLGDSLKSRLVSISLSLS